MQTPSALRKTTVDMNSKVAWSLDDCSRASGLSTRKLRQMIDEGRLRVARVGRRVLIDPAELKRAIFGLPEE